MIKEDEFELLVCKFEIINHLNHYYILVLYRTRYSNALTLEHRF